MSAPIRSMLQRFCAESVKRCDKVLYKPQQRHLNVWKSDIKFYNFGKIVTFSPNKSIDSRPLLAFKCHGSYNIVSTFTLLPSRCVTQRHVSTMPERKCWKCGRTTDNKSEIFICSCGVVQEISDFTYFQIMGIEESFDVDLVDLASKYKDLQKILHPDKYTLKAKKEKELSEMQSAIVNKAYTTLTSPLSRALYLLEQNNQPIEEQNSDVDPEFLMEIMEINEELTEADSEDALHDIEVANNLRIKECYSDISEAFKEKKIGSATEHVIRLTYFVNIDEKIKEIRRKNFG